jgi:hypothetical protein
MGALRLALDTLQDLLRDPGEELAAELLLGTDQTMVSSHPPSASPSSRPEAAFPGWQSRLGCRASSAGKRGLQGQGRHQ